LLFALGEEALALVQGGFAFMELALLLGLVFLSRRS